MYIRTTTRRNRDGSTVSYYQLAENHYNKAKKSSQTRVIYNFGRADRLDLAALQRLVHSIQRVLLRHEAQAELASPLHQGDLEFDRVYQLGVIHCLRHLWQELGVAGALERPFHGSLPTAPHEAALFIMTANRLCRPCSKLDCFENWLHEEVYLPEFQDLKIDQFYRALDFLYERIHLVEREVFNRTADLFNVDVDLIFYDTTSTYFEVDQEDEDEDDDDPGLRKRGFSKDDKPNHPQIVIGLAVTREGLPVRSWVFPGNTSDTTTIKTIKEDLRGWRLGQCILVGDAGMYSKANLEVLRRGLGRYLVAVPMRRLKEVSEEILSRGGRYQTLSDNLQVKEVWLKENDLEKRYIVCFNPEEAERQKHHREEVLTELEDLLASMWGKETHPKRACQLLASKRYGRYLRTLKSGRLKLDKGKMAREARYDGKFVITTNDPDLTAEEAGLGYKSLLVIESCFRSMKTTGLKLRPVYHWTEKRIEAHVKLCVLALLLQRAAELRCGRPWRQIRRELDGIKAVSYRTKNLEVVQSTKVTKNQREILRNLDVPTPKRILEIAEL